MHQLCREPLIYVFGLIYIHSHLVLKLMQDLLAHLLRRCCFSSWSGWLCQCLRFLVLLLVCYSNPCTLSKILLFVEFESFPWLLIICEVFTYPFHKFWVSTPIVLVWLAPASLTICWCWATASQSDSRRANRGGEGREVSPALFWKSKKVPWFWKKIPWLCPSLG